MVTFTETFLQQLHPDAGNIGLLYRVSVTRSNPAGCYSQPLALQPYSQVGILGETSTHVRMSATKLSFVSDILDSRMLSPVRYVSLIPACVCWGPQPWGAPQGGQQWPTGSGSVTSQHGITICAHYRLQSSRYDKNTRLIWRAKDLGALTHTPCTGDLEHAAAGSRCPWPRHSHRVRGRCKESRTRYASRITRPTWGPATPKSCKYAKVRRYASKTRDPLSNPITSPCCPRYESQLSLRPRPLSPGPPSPLAVLANKPLPSPSLRLNGTRQRRVVAFSPPTESSTPAAAKLLARRHHQIL